MHAEAGPTARAATLFPLVRHLSRWTTPRLARTPLRPNHITALSLGAGLAAAACLWFGRTPLDLAAGALLVAAYVLDNCDGEIARLKSLHSRRGALFDSAADAVVHAAFFVALGHGVAAATGSTLWLWLGLVACAGTVINSAISLPREYRALRDGAAGGCADPGDGAGAPGVPGPGAGLSERALFAFRELTRADFCFLVLVLAAAKLLWLLLPAAAIGAQVYWLTGLLESARRFHV